MSEQHAWVTLGSDCGFSQQSIDNIAWLVGRPPDHEEDPHFTTDGARVPHALEWDASPEQVAMLATRLERLIGNRRGISVSANGWDERHNSDMHGYDRNANCWYVVPDYYC